VTGPNVALFVADAPRHSGSILVETVPGRGATFIIRLPLDPPPELKLAA
jgi:signal transduction histidine kinase